MAVLLFAIAPVSADDEQDSAGLPVPRFVSLKSGEVNMRVGPGTRYSINWVYKREGLPVEIVQEFDQWREIRDSEGTIGWVHKQMLQGKRMAVIKSSTGVLRRSPDEQAGLLLRVESGVVGRLLECEKSWCRLQISGRKGWIEKTHIWGVYPKEEF
jgi:SH3-like domain-containing protein